METVVCKHYMMLFLYHVVESSMDQMSSQLFLVQMLTHLEIDIVRLADELFSVHTISKFHVDHFKEVVMDQRD